MTEAVPDLRELLRPLHEPRDWIAGYAWPISLRAGEDVHVSCSTPAATFWVRVVRAGAREEEVWSARNLAGARHPVPEDAHENGCRWPVAFTVRTGADWRSGLYLVRFACEDTTGRVHHNEAFFVLRPRRPTSPRLLVLSTSTWAAYNHWGGPSYYTGGVASSQARPLPRGFLDRPEADHWRNAALPPDHDPEMQAWTAYAASHEVSPWSGCAGWANQERIFAGWCEREGFALDFAASHDLETVPELLAPYRSLWSVGHDEYWSWGMRDAVESFVEGGGRAAFLSGNTAYWQVRFEDDARRVVCFKHRFEEDPLHGGERAHLTTTMWSDPLVGRPENQLTGVSFTRGGYVRQGLGVPRGAGGYTVWRPGHWAFAGTDLRYGDLLGRRHAVVGYEADGCELALEDGLPVATGRDGTPRGFTVLATAPAHLWTQDEKPAGLKLLSPLGDLEWACIRLLGADTPEHRRRLAHGHAVMGCFARARGEVFTTGCTDWAYGLVGGDAEVERVTRNLLERFSG